MGEMVSPGSSFHPENMGRLHLTLERNVRKVSHLPFLLPLIHKFNKITIIIIKTKAYWSCFCSTFHSLFSCHSLESEFSRNTVRKKE